MPSLAQLEKLLALDPNDAFVLYGLAQEHARLGQVDPAIDFYDRCLKADPNYTYAYYHKAKVLAEHQRTGEAIAVLKAGESVAKAVRDAKALGELQALLDSLE